MLKDRIALVTGGARGIGRATALRLAAEGADIIILATKESEKSKEVIKNIEEMGRRAVFIACNVACSKEVNTAVEKALEEFNKIDILVNNAGITRDQLLLRMTEEDFDQVIDVNLKGTYNVTKACIRTFVKQRYGRIINVSSVVGLMGNIGQTNYAASKAGIIGITKSIAKEYAAKGITCNAVAPGYIQTDMTQAMSEQAALTIMSQIPAKRLGTPEDVANLISFLAQDETSYITGEVIKVDGGMYI